MLSDIRVLEISAPSTMLAGQILGDFGADVVVVEPPAGAKGRRLPPFADQNPKLENSLTWHALNRNKRGITLDVFSPDGRALLETMLQKFDVIIESVDGGNSCLDGLSRPENLIVCEVTAFSKSGPKSAYKTTDGVLSAAGGAASATGTPDRAPLFFPVPQPMIEAGAEAAVATLAALAARERLGGGQTVSLQQRVAASFAALGQVNFARNGNKVPRREMAKIVGNMPALPMMFETKDGWVTITLAFVPAFGVMMQRLAAWLVEEGALSKEIGDSDLLAIVQAAQKGERDSEPIKTLIAAMIAVCKRRTKDDIVAISMQYKFMAAPIMTMADIAKFEHYKVRGLFANQRVGDKDVQVPARFAQFSDYQIEVRRPAPALSEHSVEIFTDYTGLSPIELQALFAQGVI